MIQEKFKVDTYLKWFATLLLIIGCGFNAVNIYPLGPIITGLGGVFWLIVSIMWKEWSLIVTNATLLSVNAIGLIYTIFF
jgi:hypothetical protein